METENQVLKHGKSANHNEQYSSCLNIVVTSYRNQSQVELAKILYFVCYQDNLMWYLVKMKNTREFHLISLQH